MSADFIMTRKQFIERFQDTARSLASRYGAKIWLVGGALTKQNPRDWDVRVILDDEDACRLGLLDAWARRYENLKQSRIMSEDFHIPIDFQVQLRGARGQYRSFPKLRLDDAPEDFFDAGR